MAYGAQADIESFFGTSEVLKWADHDRDGSVDAAVVAFHIAGVDDYIDSRLRPSRYQVPVEQPASSTAPVRIKYIAVRLYGVSLFQSWGLGSDQADRFEKIRQQCETELDMIADGRMLLLAKEV